MPANSKRISKLFEQLQVKCDEICSLNEEFFLHDNFLFQRNLKNVFSNDKMMNATYIFAYFCDIFADGTIQHIQQLQNI